MLVLSRKVGEKVVIGNNVVLEILEVKGKGIRIGITAPEDVPIWRGEIAFDTPTPDEPQRLERTA